MLDRPIAALLLVGASTIACRFDAPSDRPSPTKWGSVDAFDLESVDARIPDDAWARAARSVGEPGRWLSTRARVFHGHAAGAEGVTNDAWFAAVPVAETGAAEVRVALGEGGQLLELSVHGTADFDRDPIRRWSHFMKRLRRSAEARSDPPIAWEAIEPRMRRIEQRSPSDGRFARLLARTALGMSRASMTVAQFSSLLELGRRIDDAAIGAVVDDFATLASAHTELGLVLGQEATREFTAQAKRAVEMFRGMRTSLESSGPETTAEFLRPHFRSGVCSECHKSRSEGVGTWKRRLVSRAAALGVPRGVMRVGFDTPAAYGDDGRLSRRIAAAARAAVVLLDELRGFR